ncbi:unnamed protein product [Agarophyton chilense]|eukprot:gb/GEZJ01000208.1/.p1 GENE.gb/GEZJ01000208.1/~~gb/GEZJ01000208.1/.p1  ORF type:complete len:1177 (+),score=189.04 gb/GEZJ01000208.1/:1982-5512(+)
MPPQRRRLCVNQGVVEALKVELENATGEWVRKSIQRAIKNVRQCKTLILTRQDASEIQGVGNYIASIIETYLKENPQIPNGVPQHVLDAQMEAQPSSSNSRGREPTRRGGQEKGLGKGLMKEPESGESGGKKGVDPPPVNLGQADASLHVELTPPGSTSGQKRDRNGDENRRKRAKKEYIPGVGTATAALIIAMLKAMTEEDLCELRKDDICKRAERYTREKILTNGGAGPKEWYNGWSNMNKQLIPKGFVKKRGNPPVFSLTIGGQRTARICLKQFDNIQERRQLKYEPGDEVGRDASPFHSPEEGDGDDQDEIQIIPLSPSNLPYNEVGRCRSRSESCPVGHQMDKRNPKNQARKAKEVLVAHLPLKNHDNDYQETLRLQGEIDGELHGAKSTPRNAPATTSTSSCGSQGPSLHDSDMLQVTGRFSQADKQRGTRMAEKYATGKEFGIVFDGARSDSAPQNKIHDIETSDTVEKASTAVFASEKHQESGRSHKLPNMSIVASSGDDGKCRRKITDSQVDRAASVIEKLEREGYSRQDMIMISSEMHVIGKFPRTEEDLSKALRDTLRAAHEAEAEEKKRPKPLDLVLTPLESDRDNNKGNFNSSSDGADVVENALEKRGCEPLSELKFSRKSGPPSVVEDDKIIDLIDEVDSCNKNGVNRQCIYVSPESDSEWIRSKYQELQSERVVPSKPDLPHVIEEAHGVIDLVNEGTSAGFPRNHSTGVSHRKAVEQTITIDVDECGEETSPQEQPAVGSLREKLDTGRLNPVTSSVAKTQDNVFRSEVPVCIISDDDEKVPRNANYGPPRYLKNCDRQSEPPFVSELRPREVDIESAHDFGTILPRALSGVGILPNYESFMQLDETRMSNSGGPLSSCNEVIDLESIDIGRYQTTKEDLSTTYESSLNNASSGYEECEVILALDSQEKVSQHRSQTFSSFRELLKRNGVKCSVRSLPCGDAMFLARFKDATEVVLEYIIERKTINDYGASMYDGRIAKQSYVLLHSKISNPILVVEGVMKDDTHVYDQPRMHSKLAELEVCADMYVKRTKDIEDTAHFYGCILRRLQGRYRLINRAKMLERRQKYSEWHQHISQIKKMTLEQLFMLQLCSVPGLGIRKARAVISMGYTTPQALFEAYAKKENIEEKEALLNPRKSGFGARISKAVARLFCAEDYDHAGT